MIRSAPWWAGPAGLAVAALALLFALAIFGARVHWVEEAGSAERDGYVTQADSILRGELPRDPFRPAFYPLLVAGLASLGVPTFAAARLVSNLAAVTLACLAWFFGRRLAGPSRGTLAAWLAFALTAVNPNLWILGQHTTTDMTFAALAAGALAAGLAYLDRPGWRPALMAGALLGLAAFTRANALFLVPALALAWWLGGRPRRAVHLLGGAATTVLLLVPHFALRAAAFGDPFHDENWKNLAFKLYGFPDWSYLERVPFAGPLELLAADPGAVAAGFFSELGRFLLGGGLSQLLGTPLHALLFVVGAAVAVWPRAAQPQGTRRRALWLLFAAATFLCALAAAFFTWGRLLLVLLPLGNAFIAVPWGTAGWGRLGNAVKGASASPSFRWLTIVPLVLAAALVGLLAVKTFAFRLPAFAANHPYATVAALRDLEARTPPGTVLAGTSPFLGRYIDRPYVYVPDAFGAEVTEGTLYLERLSGLLADADASYLVVSQVDLRGRPSSLLAPGLPACWIHSANGDKALRIWEIDRSACREAEESKSVY